MRDGIIAYEPLAVAFKHRIQVSDEEQPRAVGTLSFRDKMSAPVHTGWHISPADIEAHRLELHGEEIAHFAHACGVL
ncbi:MAG: hypothetical protein ABJE47_02090 [bacterium]